MASIHPAPSSSAGSEFRQNMQPLSSMEARKEVRSERIHEDRGSCCQSGHRWPLHGLDGTPRREDSPAGNRSLAGWRLLPSFSKPSESLQIGEGFGERTGSDADEEVSANR